MAGDAAHRIPHPASAAELQTLLARERSGAPFLMFRDRSGSLVLFALEEERVTIGRRASNGVSLPWDGEVSRLHAEVQRMGVDWAIVDDGLSRNGTYVNGERIGGRRRVRDGDLLRVGHTPLVVRIPSEGSSALTAGAAPEAIGATISPTQRKVLTALCRPYRRGEEFPAPASNREIAADLSLSVDAVKNHLRILFAKFELSDLPQNQKRVRLVECAFRWGVGSELDP